MVTAILATIAGIASALTRKYYLRNVRHGPLRILFVFMGRTSSALL
jgi:hypothetical protein